MNLHNGALLLHQLVLQSIYLKWKYLISERHVHSHSFLTKLFHSRSSSGYVYMWNLNCCGGQFCWLTLLHHGNVSLLSVLKWATDIISLGVRKTRKFYTNLMSSMSWKTNYIAVECRVFTVEKESFSLAHHVGLWGSGFMAAHTLNLRNKWSFTLCYIYPQGNYPHYALRRRFGGIQSRSVCCRGLNYKVISSV
jgi:hypothetical protein